MGKQQELKWKDLERLPNTYELNLDTINVTDRFRNKNGDLMYVFYANSIPQRSTTCPYCKADNTLVKDGFYPERVEYTDVPIEQDRVTILVKVQRYQCTKCRATCSEDLSKEFSTDHQMTHRLCDRIASEAFDYPFVSVARRFGVDQGTVAKVFDEHSTSYLAQNRPVYAPVSLGIDEKHINKDMRGVFVDNHNGVLLEMTETRSEADMKGVLNNMIDPDKIDVVTMDMFMPYRKWVRECLPNARIIVDRFHIIHKLYEHVSEAKTEIIKGINKQLAAETDPVRYQLRTMIKNAAIEDTMLFKYGLDKLYKYPAKERLLTAACDEFPELNHLRLIKEGFQRIYPPREEDCLPNRRPRPEAEAMYKAWCDLIPPTGSKNIADWEAKYKVPAKFYTGFRSFQQTVANWYDEIFNYFETDCGESNSVAEGVNNLIGIISRDGSGYSFKRLRVKSLYRSLAEAPVHYFFAKELRKNNYIDAMNTFGKMTSDTIGKMNFPQHTEEEYIYRLVGTTEHKKREPFSVLWYMDQNQYNPDSLLEYL